MTDKLFYKKEYITSKEQWSLIRFIKPAVALTASFKFLGGAVSWLVACNSNKYEVLFHSQNKSLHLSMGG